MFQIGNVGVTVTCVFRALLIASLCGCGNGGAMPSAKNSSDQPATTTGKPVTPPIETQVVAAEAELEPSTDAEPGEPLPVYFTPFYDSTGPQIDVGEFSEELTDVTRETVTPLLAKLKLNWNTLPVETMYVAAIRLFDLGRKDEAVYWFYSAQWRARLYEKLISVDTENNIGAAEFEQKHAHNAFFEILGPYLNDYAMRDLVKLQTLLARVKADSKDCPDFHAIYPGHQFVAKELWRDKNLENAAGFAKWEKHVAAHLQPGRENDINRTKINGKTRLHEAVESDDRKQFLKLLSDGVDPNICDVNGENAVHAAAWKKEVFWLHHILKHGGNPNLPHKGDRNKTSIFFAISVGQPDCVKELIAAGADLTYRERYGQTPLTSATAQRNYSALRVILDTDVDPTLVDGNGHTIFTYGFNLDIDDPFLRTLEEHDVSSYLSLRKKMIELGHINEAGIPQKRTNDEKNVKPAPRDK